MSAAKPHVEKEKRSDFPAFRSQLSYGIIIGQATKNNVNTPWENHISQDALVAYMASKLLEGEGGGVGLSVPFHGGFL